LRSGLPEKAGALERHEQTTHLSANLPGDLEALRITSGRIDLLQKSK
jgi:hypothetical protein